MTHSRIATDCRISAAVLTSRELQRITALLDFEGAAITGVRQSFSLFVRTERRANYISSSSDRSVIREPLLMIIADWDAGMPANTSSKVQ